MFEAFIITLREGIEVALVVGIILIFLRRSGQGELARWVFRGLAAALAGSLVGAAVLHRLPLHEEATEGTMMLLAALFVAATVVWMWRHARHLKGRIEGRLERLAGAGRAAGPGLFLLTLVLVLREGIETVLLLAAVRLNTDDILAFLGGVGGLAVASVFGVALVKGSMRIDVGRFFRITGIVLLIFSAHLLAGSLHEFGEAGIVPIGPGTMRVLGPVVKSQALVLMSLLILPLLLVLVPGRAARPEPAAPPGPERRLQQARARRDRRWRVTAGLAGILVIGALTISLTYSRFPTTFDPPRMVSPGGDGTLRIPAAGLDDGELHRFGVDLDGLVVRFLLMQTGDGLRAAVDACTVCGAYGYVANQRQIVCLACAADINPATLGAGGGCNPLPLASRLEAGSVVIRLADLERHRAMFAAATGTEAAVPGR